MSIISIIIISIIIFIISIIIIIISIIIIIISIIITSIISYHIYLLISNKKKGFQIKQSLSKRQKKIYIYIRKKDQDLLLYHHKETHKEYRRKGLSRETEKDCDCVQQLFTERKNGSWTSRHLTRALSRSLLRK